MVGAHSYGSRRAKRGSAYGVEKDFAGTSEPTGTIRPQIPGSGPYDNFGPSEQSWHGGHKHGNSHAWGHGNRGHGRYMGVTFHGEAADEGICNNPWRAAVLTQGGSDGYRYRAIHVPAKHVPKVGNPGTLGLLDLYVQSGTAPHLYFSELGTHNLYPYG